MGFFWQLVIFSADHISLLDFKRHGGWPLQFPKNTSEGGFTKVTIWTLRLPDSSLLESKNLWQWQVGCREYLHEVSEFLFLNLCQVASYSHSDFWWRFADQKWTFVLMQTRTSPQLHEFQGFFKVSTQLGKLLQIQDVSMTKCSWRLHILKINRVKQKHSKSDVPAWSKFLNQKCREVTQF